MELNYLAFLNSSKQFTAQKMSFFIISPLILDTNMHGNEQFSILKLCGICQSAFGLSLGHFQTDSSNLQHEKCHFFIISALILDKEKY